MARLSLSVLPLYDLTLYTVWSKVIFLLLSTAHQDAPYWTVIHFYAIMRSAFTIMGIISIHRGTLYGTNCKKIRWKLSGYA